MAQPPPPVLRLAQRPEREAAAASLGTEWAGGARLRPARRRPPRPIPPRPGLGRPPPAPARAVNERQAPSGAGCKRRGDAGLRGGARPAEMYGKEGSAPGLGAAGVDSANFQDANLCPLRGPDLRRQRRLGAWLGCIGCSVRGCLCGEDKDALGQETLGSWEVLWARRVQAPGRWEVIHRGQGKPVVSSGGDLGKASLFWSRADRVGWWRWSCDSICRINKSGLCLGVLCGNLVQNGGRSLLSAFCPLGGCGRRRPKLSGRGVSQSWEPHLSALDGLGLCLPLGSSLPNFQIGPP